jgi:hypothetical protein
VLFSPPHAHCSPPPHATHHQSLLPTPSISVHPNACSIYTTSPSNSFRAHVTHTWPSPQNSWLLLHQMSAIYRSTELYILSIADPCQAAAATSGWTCTFIKAMGFWFHYPCKAQFYCAKFLIPHLVVRGGGGESPVEAQHLAWRARVR